MKKKHTATSILIPPIPIPTIIPTSVPLDKFPLSGDGGGGGDELNEPVARVGGGGGVGVGSVTSGADGGGGGNRELSFVGGELAGDNEDIVGRIRRR